MTDPIDHDQLFKELLSTFFVEFIELFLPNVAEIMDRHSITFLPQEYFTDLITGDRKIIDLLAKVRLRDQEAFFVIHLENQSSSEADFAQRIFFYFAKLHQEYRLPIYPVVIFSFDQPKRPEVTQYQVSLADQEILRFNFTAIQLNQLSWRDFLSQPNPIAAALMAKMQIQPSDRPKVKAECLRLLATLKLDPARTRLISGFVDTYLTLDVTEEQTFQAELDRMGLNKEEKVMEIVTSWMRTGMRNEAEKLVLRQLNRRFGPIEAELEQRIQALSIERVEDLSDALLDFSDRSQLVRWLEQQS
jgi:Domain of unknown function (DUF4351)/Putative transposase, YhgA-like